MSLHDKLDTYSYTHPAIGFEMNAGQETGLNEFALETFTNVSLGTHAILTKKTVDKCAELAEWQLNIIENPERGDTVDYVIDTLQGKIDVEVGFRFETKKTEDLFGMLAGITHQAGVMSADSEKPEQNRLPDEELVRERGKADGFARALAKRILNQ